jgi:hypothetical protein
MVFGVERARMESLSIFKRSVICPGRGPNPVSSFPFFEFQEIYPGGCHEVPSLPGIDGYGKILRAGNALLGIQVSLLRGDPRPPYLGKSK